MVKGQRSSTCPRLDPRAAMALSGRVPPKSRKFSDQSSQSHLPINSDTELPQNLGPNDLSSGTTPHAGGNLCNIENDGPLEDNEVNEALEEHQFDLSDRDSEPDVLPENMGFPEKS